MKEFSRDGAPPLPGVNKARIEVSQCPDLQRSMGLEKVTTHHQKCPYKTLPVEFEPSTCEGLTPATMPVLPGVLGKLAPRSGEVLRLYHQLMLPCVSWGEDDCLDLLACEHQCRFHDPTLRSRHGDGGVVGGIASVWMRVLGYGVYERQARTLGLFWPI